MQRFTSLGKDLPDVCRLGVATRGNTTLDPEDVHWAIERGVNYFNWCGRPDGLSRAIGELGCARREVAVAAQFKARTADGAEREFDWILEEIGSDRLDVATFYYVESNEEWRDVVSPGGAWDVLRRRKSEGQLGLIGLTSHQRSLAARWASEGRLDMLMVRYNAAHRGAEDDVFPVTKRIGIPVVTFTGLRWRDLLAETPSDPPHYEPPGAADCYRFCLSNESVSVAITAPNGRRELEKNLHLLDEWRSFDSSELREIREHGDRVHRHARQFG